MDVAIVEDETILQDRYAEIIGTADDMNLSWTAATVGEALQASAQRASDVLLVDLGLPDGSGIDVIRFVRKQHAHCEIMVVSVFGDEQSVVASIEAGASGYLLKDALPEQFLSTIRELCAGGSPISPSVARILLNCARGAGSLDLNGHRDAIDLADRETEILSLVAKGFGFGEIGRLLGISSNTVKTHVYRIYRKLSVHSRCEAVYEANRLGLLRL